MKKVVLKVPNDTRHYEYMVSDDFVLDEETKRLAEERHCTLVIYDAGYTSSTNESLQYLINKVTKP